ncbi:hypothetical protein PR003_g22188 [Phytophthora rubi]|uniref:Uncharacterized protein n=1 Tax=Phytophthora rubi TaxID=129364 RepID=A0A6A4DAA2_9STRA|nr:hypothetical protein PR003_g22188 [Phytophthora rubi]
MKRPRVCVSGFWTILTTTKSAVGLFPESERCQVVKLRRRNPYHLPNGDFCVATFW